MAEKKPTATTRLKPERIQSQLKSERVQGELRPDEESRVQQTQTSAIRASVTPTSKSITRSTVLAVKDNPSSTVPSSTTTPFSHRGAVTACTAEG